MNKRVIAYDLDDTLMDQLDKLVLWHNRAYGTRLARAHYVDHTLNSVWGTDNAETSRRAAEFHHSEEYDQMQPFSGVSEALRRARARGSELHVVTGRPSRMRPRTETQVRMFFPGAFADIHFCNSYQAAERVSKAVVCARIGATLLVDDVFDHGKECVEAGIPALLIDHEWNRHHVDLPRNMYRILHVEEVEDYL
jgi:hypothetical protein